MVAAARGGHPVLPLPLHSGHATQPMPRQAAHRMGLSSARIEGHARVTRAAPTVAPTASCAASSGDAAGGAGATRPRGRTAGTGTERKGCPSDEEEAERGVAMDETRAVSAATRDMDDARGELR